MSTTSRLDVITVGGTTIEAIESSGLESNINILREHGSADVTPLFIGHGEQAPRISFTSKDILGLCVTEGVGLLGKALDDVSYQYWKLVPEAGRNARSAESHVSCAINQGVVYWETITLRNNEASTVDAVMAASYDGTNGPIVVTGSTALPTTELSPADFFGCGPIQINGTLVSQIQEVTISSGLQVEPRFSDNVPWPYRINIKQAQPTVTILTETISNLTTYGIVGGALNGTTGLAVYGRKFIRNATGGAQRVAAATTDHLKFAFPSGTYRVDTVNAQSLDAAQLNIVVEVSVEDSGDSPLTISTAAIPTS